MGIETGMPNFQDASVLDQLQKTKKNTEVNQFKYVDENGVVSFYKNESDLIKFRKEKLEERN